MINLEKVLADAGATAPIGERVNLLLRFFNSAVGHDPDELIISEYVVSENGEEEHVYSGVFFLLGDRLYESKNFLHHVTLDQTPLSEFTYWELSPKNFDTFDEAVADSQLTVKLSNGLLGATIRASGMNCNRLRRLFLDRMRDKIA